MTDPTFDPWLAELLARHAKRAVDPFDPLEIAETAIAGRRRARARRLDLRLLAVAAVLLLGGGLLAALVIGSRPQPVPETGSIMLAYADHELRSAWRLDLDSGAATEVVTLGRDVSVAPDGRHVAVHAGDDVRLLDTRTGAGRLLAGAAPGALTSRYDQSGEPDWRDFVWSPGGRWISWLACAARCTGEIAAGDGSLTNPIPGAGPAPWEISSRPFWWWNDDDHLFGAPHRGLTGMLAANGDASNPQPCPDPGCGSGTWYGNGDGGQLTHRVGAKVSTTIQWPGKSVSAWGAADDSAAVVILTPTTGSHDRGELWLVHADESKVQVDLGPYLADVPRLLDPPAFSPDGTRVTVSAALPTADHDSDPRTLLVVDVATGETLARVDDAGLASWSPDGTRLAIVRVGGQQVEIVNADGTDRHAIGRQAFGPIDQLAWVR